MTPRKFVASKQTKPASLLTEFEQSFADEAALRQILYGLITRWPGVLGVQITHGTQEYGKDIVFYAPDFLGRLQLHACVVKNNKIDGSTKSSGAREVVTQALECFDTPHVNAAGQEEYVARVFVISPHDTPPATMNSIRGVLKQRAGQVEFLCGTLLLESFSTYWKEYLLYNSSALNLYVASVSRSIMGDDPVHFLLRRHQLLTGELESLQSRYVPQGFKKTHLRMTCNLDSGMLNKRSLLAATSWAGSKNISANLAGFSSLLRAMPDSEEMGSLPDELETMSEAFTAAWNKSYAAYRIEVENVGKKALPRTEAQVAVEQGFLSPYESALTSASARTKDLLRSMAALAAGNPTEPVPELSMSSAKFTAIDLIRDVVREAPTSFTSVGSEISFPLQEDEVLRTEGRHVLVTAPAGYGKTSFCKVHAMRDALALEQQRSDAIPVYISLHSLATVSVTEEMFLERPEIQAIMGSSDSTDMRWTFYLDGLDEIADLTQRSEVLKVMRVMAGRFPKAKIIVTSREYVVNRDLRWLTRVELSEFSDGGVQDIASKWLADASMVSDFTAELAKSRTLERLARIPLLATLILAVFKKERSLPSNKSVLYETFIDLLCGGWDYVKSVNRNSRYGRHEKVAVLTRFAGSLHLNKLREGAQGLFRKAISDMAPSRLDDFDGMLGEMVEDGLVQRSGGNLIFSHLSFQEFLAAREFGDPSGQRNNAVLMDFLRGDDWWREVLAFYVSGPNRPEEMERWIRKAGETAEAAGFQSRPRELFLIASIQEVFPGWKPSLLKQTTSL